MDVGEYTLKNSDKVERAINGTVLDRGKTVGGVGTDADESELLAEYDRLGGLILFKGNKVKTGCFYNFKSKKAVEKPDVILEFKIDGETIEVPADEPLPLEIRAAEQAKARKAEKAAAKRAEKEAAKTSKKSKGKKGKKNVEEDEADDEADEKDADADEGELA